MGEGKRALQIGVVAAVAGLAWGYIRHRNDPRVGGFAILQALEWFVAYGGAAALIDIVRASMEDDDDLEVTERVTHTRQTMTDQAAGLFRR